MGKASERKTAGVSDLWYVKRFMYCTELDLQLVTSTLNRDRILGRNWDKSLKSFPPCYSQSPLLKDFTPPSPLSKSGLILVCNANIVNRNIKSGNSQDYAQKPQRNCTFMNLCSGWVFTNHPHLKMGRTQTTCYLRRYDFLWSQNRKVGFSRCLVRGRKFYFV